ncbi:hypothetical protein PQX77_020950 [Marasmius sp. AFHP31]|nr:hypothetical protein PQX77_020950 [Marasmius sp. AFHP31]
MPRRDREQGSSSGGDTIVNVINIHGWLPLPDIEGSVPEGGAKAWFVVVGLACCLFTTYGYINSWGVFQTYYEQNLHIGLTPATISWIGAAQRAGFFFSVVIVKRLFERGYYEQYFMPASILLVASLVLTAECTEFWQMLLCQGILSGITAGCLVGNISAMCAQYFRKRYELALAFAYGGSALGGVVYPVVAGIMLPELGFPWTMRILGWVGFVGLAITNITVRRRLKPVKRETPFVSFKPLKKPAFALYCMALIFQIIGFYTSSTAVTKGVASPEFGYFLIAVMNATTGLGRVASHWVAPRYGPFNVIIPSLAMSGVILVCGWTMVETEAELLTFTVAYALCAAPHNALAAESIYLFGGTGDLGLRIGLFNLFASIAGLVGPPTSGEINLNVGMRAMAGWMWIDGIAVVVLVEVYYTREEVSRESLRVIVGLNRIEGNVSPLPIFERCSD